MIRIGKILIGIPFVIILSVMQILMTILCMLGTAFTTITAILMYLTLAMILLFQLQPVGEIVIMSLAATGILLSPLIIIGGSVLITGIKQIIIQELSDYAAEFGQKYTSSFEDMRYIDNCYLPMAELVQYLYENDFTIYVISGTERTTTRAIIANSPISEYVDPSHVIGTDFEVKQKGHEDVSSNMDFTYENGDELVFTGGFIQKNLNANKSIYIEREIGQRPILAFGNSMSDTSMMNYTIDDRNPYPSQAYMIVADDAEREWGAQSWEEKSAEYTEMGYTPVSMKNDFGQIYPEGVTKASEQYNKDDWAADTADTDIAA